MIELFQYAFMQRALLAGALVGLLCALVGVYVVHRGLSFMGAGIAHASFGGVALGVWLGINPVLAAMLFCLAVAWVIAWLSLNTHTREDTAIGILFTAMFALGILLMSTARTFRDQRSAKCRLRSRAGRVRPLTSTSFHANRANTRS